MEHSRLVSALRLPDGMFSENAGTEVGSDLLILQKETGKGVQNEWERLFTQSVSIESGGESFTENALFAEGNHAVATTYRIGADAYGKPAPVYTHTGGIEGIARDLEARKRSNWKPPLSLPRAYPSSPYSSNMRRPCQPTRSPIWSHRER